MSSRKSVVQHQVDAATAIDLVASVTAPAKLSLERAVYYPYFHFACQCNAPGLLLRKKIKLQCLIDAVNGQGATADGFETEQQSLDASDVIDVGVTERQARAAAERIVTHTLGKQLRTIANFQLQLNSRRLVYKQFWVVSDASIAVMVDSVNGGMHPLQTRAASCF